MKVTFVLLVFISCVNMIYSRPNIFKFKDAKRIHAECQANPESHVNEYLEQLQELEPIVVPNMARHTLCTSIKAGLQYENGDIAVERLRSDLEEVSNDEAKIKEIVDTCGVRAPGSPEDAAMAFGKCLCSHWSQHALCVCST
ncbi:uncharacterized protein LOC114328499 [Diabrotica virgifera virgifera]|uniref:Uncharacterized protein LOC114328499 n=1 Tax=Diabrotica virgifera virgifera TaxID=50390 RepID=A0A6P7FEC6_DIAVI|nr:uncharacterized protein LOC114328499 [Diabrotica virgifera virgifera]